MTRADDGPVIVDARGLRCPLPVIRLAQAAVGLPDGAVIVVLATDPAAEHDIPAWCTMRGHRLRGLEWVPEQVGGSVDTQEDLPDAAVPHLRASVLVGGGQVDEGQVGEGPSDDR